MLKEQTRAEVAEQLKEAISFGDLSENAEYEAARERQAQVEHRIFEIEEILKNYEIIDAEKKSKKKSVVSIGSIVKIQVTSEEKQFDPEEFRIVGSTESNIFESKLSNESPIGSLIMGHEAGETVRGKAPSGTVEVSIISI